MSEIRNKFACKIAVEWQKENLRQREERNGKYEFALTTSFNLYLSLLTNFELDTWLIWSGDGVELKIRNVSLLDKSIEIFEKQPSSCSGFDDPSNASNLLYFFVHISFLKTKKSLIFLYSLTLWNKQAGGQSNQGDNP